MARTTRATRQQRDVDGTDASPLVSLDDNPRKQKTVETKAKKDSSKTSKKAHQIDDTSGAPVKVKQTSKKIVHEEDTEGRPTKAKHTPKKPSQEVVVEETTVQVKATSKETRAPEPVESSPGKTKHSSKKQQEPEGTEKSPVKAKRAKKTHQEEPAEQEHANTKKPRSKKAASADKTSKTARAGSPAKDAPANAQTATREASTEPIAIIQTSPTKATRKRARSPAKIADAKTNGVDSIMSNEPTAENPTSPVKAALARAGSPVASNELGTAENPTSPVKAALARAGSPVASDEVGTAENPTSPVKAALARAGSPVESNELGTAENPTSPVKAALARAGSPVASDDLQAIDNSASPTKSARTRARSPAKPSPSKMAASPSRQKDTAARAQPESTTSDTFPFALSSSPLSPLTNPDESSSSLFRKDINAESAPEDSPCPSSWQPGSDVSDAILDRNDDTSEPSHAAHPSNIDSLGFVSQILGLKPLKPAFGNSFLQEGKRDSVSVWRCSPRGFPAGSVSDSSETRGAQAQRVKLVLATTESTVSPRSPLSASLESPLLRSGGSKVPRTVLAKDKALTTASNSPTTQTYPSKGGVFSGAKLHVRNEPKNNKVTWQGQCSQEPSVTSKAKLLSEETQHPVVTGRLQRQLNREAMVFVKFWIDSATFATDRERDLQGTYCIPKTVFLHFFLTLRSEQKVLTQTVSPKPQKSAKAPSSHTYPRKVSSNDSTPTKRKLKLPESDDEQPTPSKRLRTEAKPRTTQKRSPTKTNGARVAKSPVKQKRYAKQGGYDKNGNLVLPGQELLDSTTDEELTRAPPVMISGPSPLAMVSSASRTQDIGHRSPTKQSRSQRDVNGFHTPSKTNTAHQGDVSPPQNSFNAPATPIHAPQPSTVPATAPNPRTPGRRWNLAGRVTASIGKLNPFSFFARPTQDLESPPAPQIEPEVVDAPVVEPVVEPVFVRANEPSHDRMEFSPNPEVVETQPSPTNNQQALIVADTPDTQAEISDLLFSVLQMRCPDIADERLVSTVQASLDQSEGLARHKAEEAQRRLDSIDDPLIKRLLVLLERQYPDLGSSEILAKLEEQIYQQPLVAGPKTHLDTALNSAKKRKRPTSPDIIPNPVGKSYGMDLDFFGSDSDSEEESRQEVAEPERPSKAPRLSKDTPPHRAPPPRQPGTEPAPATKRQGNVHFLQSNSAMKPKDDPKRASRYTGSIFRDSHDTTGNIFAAASHQEPPSSDKSAGRFEVPLSSSDSDDSDSELPATPSKPGSLSQNKTTSGGGSILKGTPLNAAAKAAKEAATKEPAAKEPPAKTGATEPSKDSHAAPSPPPAPTPAHAALPAAPNGQGQHDPVALARAQANKYAPKTSSKLKSVSRLSNSPAMKSSVGNLLATGKNGVKRNANIPLVNVLDTYQLDAQVREEYEPWDRKHSMDWSTYELEPAIKDAFATWDSLEIDPVMQYQLPSDVAASLGMAEYD